MAQNEPYLCVNCILTRAYLWRIIMLTHHIAVSIHTHKNKSICIENIIKYTQNYHLVKQQQKIVRRKRKLQTKGWKKISNADRRNLSAMTAEREKGSLKSLRRSEIKLKLKTKQSHFEVFLSFVKLLLQLSCTYSFYFQVNYTYINIHIVFLKEKCKQKRGEKKTDGS